MIGTPVIGFGIGTCDSGAITIMLACGPRLATPNCRFLAHLAYSKHEGPIDDKIEERLAAKLEMSRDHQDQLEKIYVAETGQTLERVRYLLKRGTDFSRQLSAKEALELGFIDEIVTQMPKEFSFAKPA